MQIYFIITPAGLHSELLTITIKTILPVRKNDYLYNYNDPKNAYVFCMQLGRSKGESTFTPYDFGTTGNLNRYGQVSPPPYNLSQVTAPVYIVSSPNDFLADPTVINNIYYFKISAILSAALKKDVAWLLAKLPNAKSIIVTDSKYNHLDFLLAKTANEVVFKQIFSLLPLPDASDI